MANTRKEHTILMDHKVRATYIKLLSKEMLAFTMDEMSYIHKYRIYNG